MLGIDTKSVLGGQRCSSSVARLSAQLPDGSNLCAVVNQQVSPQPRGYPATFGVTPNKIAGVTPRKSGVTPGFECTNSFRFRDSELKVRLVLSRFAS